MEQIAGEPLKKYCDRVRSFKQALENIDPERFYTFDRVCIKVFIMGLRCDDLVTCMQKRTFVNFECACDNAMKYVDCRNLNDFDLKAKVAEVMEAIDALKPSKRAMLSKPPGRKPFMQELCELVDRVDAETNETFKPFLPQLLCYSKSLMNHRIKKKQTLLEYKESVSVLKR